jgi:hypothetical protein
MPYIVNVEPGRAAALGPRPCCVGWVQIEVTPPAKGSGVALPWKLFAILIEKFCYLMLFCSL